LQQKILQLEQELKLQEQLVGSDKASAVVAAIASTIAKVELLQRNYVGVVGSAHKKASAKLESGQKECL
jgi:hypothetical protein